MSNGYRIEKDSMGELKVPVDALYAAQTQRAIENFPVSGLKMPPAFIRAVALIKQCAAEVNQELGLLDPLSGAAIQSASKEIVEGRHLDQFPIDVFQTGSGTSTNMNANEVIATLASREAGQPISPNDHVNMGQSSNDTIPTAIHLSAALECKNKLLPALDTLANAIETRSGELISVVKTGRTHLMDAMPITLGQELNAWASQIRHGIDRIEASLPRIHRLAQGGTAVGTGINAHPEFAERIAKTLSHKTGLKLLPNRSFFESLSTLDAAVELSGQLKTIAVSLMKIANDLRWMNSGPLAGLAEIQLPTLQPGSSIMPGKVNPVMCEMLVQVCLYAQGLAQTVVQCGRDGQFELNVTLPLMAHCLHEAIHVLANGAGVFAERCVAGLEADAVRCRELVDRSLMLVTALNPHIGYDQAAAVAKEAFLTGKTLREIVLAKKLMDAAALDAALDPRSMTRPGASAPGE